MAVGYRHSHGISIIPMTRNAYEFVERGIKLQASGVEPRLLMEDVAQPVVENFAQTEIQVRLPESRLNGYDVFIVFSYEPPINERVMEERLAMQIARRAGADRTTVVAPYTPYSRGDKPDQYHGSVALLDYAEAHNMYDACHLTCDMHAPVTLGFFRNPARMLSLRNVMMTEIAKRYDPDVIVAPDSGSVKLVKKWSESLKPGIDLERGVLDKSRRGNDDNAMSERYFGDAVKDKKVLIFDDEVATGGSLVSAANVLREDGAAEIRAAAYHGILVGPAIRRLVESPITELIVTNTVPVSDEKIIQSNGKLQVVPVEGYIVEAIRKWHIGESLRPMIEYAY